MKNNLIVTKHPKQQQKEYKGFYWKKSWEIHLHEEGPKWCLSKQVFLKILHISQKKSVLKSFFIKFQVFRPATLLKKDASTSIFLWNSQNI